MSSQHENDTVASNDENPIDTTNNKRRVRFPSDESQLRTITIAPEPLSNQPLLSLGVILQRYRGTCQRLQIRPLNCLLDQLSTIEDTRKSFNDRINCLKIANERLDVKHIDAIEEILSRCRFHTLDLEASFSDDAALVQFFDVIEYYESCIHLNLSNNRSMNVQSYQALTRYLRKTRCLERLDMNSMRFDDIGMLGFGRSLRMSSTLYELHLESCQLNGKALQRLIQNLRLCPCLRELYLCDNRLQVQDSVLINDLIRTCGQYLHVLDLRSNSLQDGGMSHIASQLSQYDENHVHQNSIYKISFQSNQLTYQGVGFLAKSLLHNRTIRSLNLSHNPITNEGLYLLRDTLLTNRTINELILRNCRLTDQAAIALAEYIAESSTIQYLDLRENNIQVGGICGMAIAMKNNKSLLRLDFDQVLASSNANFQPSSNIDKSATNSGGLLSFSGLRRMTIGFGGLTGSAASNANGAHGHAARELVEQKLKWINDIECICERNLLLYEDQLRKQQEQEKREQEEQQQNGQIFDIDEEATVNGINERDGTITQSDDVFLEEKNPDETISLENKQESVTSDGNASPSPLNNSDHTPVVTDEIPQSDDVSIQNSGITIETQIDASYETSEIVPETEKSAECQPNNDNQENLPINSTDEKLPLTDLSSIANHNENDLIDDDDELDDDKNKIRHSDSLYLIRQKVHHDENDTSDDESDISSSSEQQPQTTEDVQTNPLPN